ncbi:helix-turn-helix domain-containing protein [Peribacillus simplex]|uniref:hypothetical protein n=1 Tax=Peribacillus simplex TaxID=1478 RepID=UPI002989D1CA|nr:hypothetical protein [Peribacillus simplex]MBX9955095.1 helix-turn-helix domain-containing protein [Peribacillus simplex]
MEKGQTVSIAQACATLGIGITTFYKYRDRGRLRVIPPTKAGVPVEDIQSILDERERVLASQGEDDSK